MNDAKVETDVLSPTRRHRVVALDDERSALRALERLLRHEPYEVRTTYRPREALGWIAEGNVSLLLSDHLMPEMTGLELTEAVRKVAPATLCVLLTGYADRVILEPGWQTSIREMIEKPWNDRDLRRTIRLLLRELELKEGQDPGSP